MKIPVKDSVLQETTKCQHNFSCLESGQCGDRKMCEVDYVDGPNLLILVSREDATCPYRTKIADRQICMCPVRCYIYCNEK